MSARQGRSPAQRSLVLSPAAEKAQREETVLFRQYMAWRKGMVADLLAGPYGAQAAALRAFLRRLSPDARPPATGQDLVAYVRDAAWLRGAEDPVRATARWMISTAIVWARGKRGLPPFDDPMPGQPASAWQIIHGMLRERQT